MRALMAKVLQGDDPDGDTISKICSLINARRQNLVAIGLERRERELDVNEYLARKAAENPPEATIDVKSEPAGVVVTASDESSAPGPPRPAGAGSGSTALTDSPEPRDAHPEGTDIDSGERE
jgi:hypothetical protein